MHVRAAAVQNRAGSASTAKPVEKVRALAENGLVRIVELGADTRPHADLPPVHVGWGGQGAQPKRPVNPVSESGYGHYAARSASSGPVPRAVALTERVALRGPLWYQAPVQSPDSSKPSADTREGDGSGARVSAAPPTHAVTARARTDPSRGSRSGRHAGS